MIVPDANLLLYAYHPKSVQHQASRAWLETVLTGPELVRFPWQTIWAFLRISTNPRVFEIPLSIAEATTIVSSWLERPHVGIVEPEERHWQILKSLLESAQCSGTLVTDATLAAIAIEHGGTIYSTDQDLSRFSNLTWINPLQTQ